MQTDINSLKSQLNTIQDQIRNIQQASNPPAVTYQNITYSLDGNLSLSGLFDQVKSSVVVVQGLLRQVDFFGRTFYSQVQGSGFVASHSGRILILTNNHVVKDAVNITVIFTDGKVYSATIAGSNANADFAALTTAVSISNYKPLEIIGSSPLKVGDPVIVEGHPMG